MNLTRPAGVGMACSPANHGKPYPSISRARHPITRRAWVGVSHRGDQCDGCRQPMRDREPFVLLPPEKPGTGMFVQWCWNCAASEIRRIHSHSLLR